MNENISTGIPYEQYVQTQGYQRLQNIASNTSTVILGGQIDLHPESLPNIIDNQKVGPVDPKVNQRFFDAVSEKLLKWTGTDWVESNGSTVLLLS